MTEIVFWSAVAVAAYVYVGYPLVLLLLQIVHRRPVARRSIEPTVSVLIAAYNEEAVIDAKLRNALAVDYPADRLEIVVASDGSSDDTVRKALAFTHTGRVRVIDHPVNRGKLTVLNDAVPALRGEIVVLSDAASFLAPNAIRLLVRNFADPRVGGVSGTYRVDRTAEASLGHQEDMYWRYETLLKRLESNVASILGAHGSLYALRRELYPFPPASVINDDYVIPLRIVQQGHRVVYEHEAVATEDAREMQGFSRRVRIMRGNLAQLGELRALLWPPRWLPLFFFCSHKVGRLLVPAAMLVTLGANLLLPGSGFYQATLLLQLLFYASVAVAALGSAAPRVLRLPYYFCMVNAALFVAMYRAVRGDRLVWKSR